MRKTDTSNAEIDTCVQSDAIEFREGGGLAARAATQVCTRVGEKHLGWDGPKGDGLSATGLLLWKSWVLSTAMLVLDRRRWKHWKCSGEQESKEAQSQETIPWSPRDPRGTSTNVCSGGRFVLSCALHHFLALIWCSRTGKWCLDSWPGRIWMHVHQSQ